MVFVSFLSLLLGLLHRHYGLEVGLRVRKLEFEEKKIKRILLHRKPPKREG
jgi:hypothetical protein